LVAAGAFFTNHGAITGGNRGLLQDPAAAAGAGGVGVEITASGSFSNSGVITGGAGGAA
jgi:hypothetical protein